MNVGSGLALLTVATVVADILAVYILPGRKKIRPIKIQPLNMEESLHKSEADYLSKGGSQRYDIIA